MIVHGMKQTTILGHSSVAIINSIKMSPQSMTVVRGSKCRRQQGDPSEKYVIYLFSEVHKWQAMTQP